MQNVIMVGAIGILVALVVIGMIISRIIYICPPNEVLIFSAAIAGSRARTTASSVIASCKAAVAFASRSSRSSIAWTSRTW